MSFIPYNLIIAAVCLLFTGFVNASDSTKGCGGDNQSQCQYKAAKYVKKKGCAKGEFVDPRNGGECWTCPSGSKRTVFAVDGSKACEAPASTKFKKAKKKRQNTKIGQGCPKGQFWDAKGGKGALGACYSCDGWKRTADAVTSGKACKKVQKAKDYKASYKGKSGCAKGEFGDPRKGGECWSCGKDYNRTATAVTDKNSCVVKSGLACDNGNVLVGKKCYKKNHCGKNRQRPCLAWERVPSCRDELREDFDSNKCIKLKKGETPFTAGMKSLSDRIAKESYYCKKALIDEGFKIKSLDPKGHLPKAGKCSIQYAAGFWCAAPLQFKKISGALDLIQKVNKEYQSKPCNVPLKREFSKATLKRKNSKVAQGCPKGQFWDSKGGKGLLGACYSCPKDFKRTGYAVDNEKACIEESGVGQGLRGACAVGEAIAGDSVKALKCVAAIIKSGDIKKLLSGKPSSPYNTLCTLAGETAFGKALSVAMGGATENAPQELKKFIKALKLIYSTVSAADKANKVSNKISEIAECKAIMHDK